MPRALDELASQPRVREFLSSALYEGRLSHAYLFLGAPGAGMERAAEALAKCVLCPNGGDGTCDECVRVAHGSHPDYHRLAPGSATGYLVAQIRELIADVSLAPVRAHAKVYVLERAELLRGTAANALLKTLEEPPEGVLFVLIARSADSVMQTISSRCQQVPFRALPADDAARELQVSAGVGPEQARIALSVAQTPDAARALLLSPDRTNVRRLVVRTLGELAQDDSWDVLLAARELLEAVQVAAGTMRRDERGRKLSRDKVVRAERDETVQDKEDFYTASALKQLEATVRRDLTRRERSGMMEALAAADSLLRDVLLRCEDPDAQIVNVDVAQTVDRICAGATTTGALEALAATRRAADDLAHNVSPQLTLEVMLLSVKEALSCPPSFR